MSYKILTKFIKDISFEIPNAQTFTMLEKEISKYILNFDIKSNQFKDNIIEVNTVLRLTPNQEVKNKMLTEINLAALVFYGSIRFRFPIEPFIILFSALGIEHLRQFFIHLRRSKAEIGS